MTLPPPPQQQQQPPQAAASMLYHRNGGGGSSSSGDGYKTNDDAFVSTRSKATSYNGSNNSHDRSSVSKDSSQHAVTEDTTTAAVTLLKMKTDETNEEDDEIRRIAQLSNTALENMAHSMMNESSQLSMSLTQQLSTTTSGQHLLHTTSSLQVAIPTNINALLQHNTPLLHVCEQYEHYLYHDQCTILHQQIQYIQDTIQRYHQIQSLRQILQDLQMVETVVTNFNNCEMESTSIPWKMEYDTSTMNNKQNKMKLPSRGSGIIAMENEKNETENNNINTTMELNHNGNESMYGTFCINVCFRL